MIPSNHTLEIVAQARMADRLLEAEQRRLIQRARQDAAGGGQPHALRRQRFGWLRQLVMRITGALHARLDAFQKSSVRSR